MVLRYCGSDEVEVGSRADEAEDFCLTRLSGCDSGVEGNNRVLRSREWRKGF